MENSHLLIDGLIIIFYFVAITCIGIYMGKREDNLADYALGGRKMPWWAVMASIIAAETSAATFLTVPAEGFTGRGLLYVQLVIGVVLGRLVVGYVFLKPFYQFKVFTVYDYLAIRFGVKTKNYVSGLFLVMRALGSGFRVYVPALVMVLAWKLFIQKEQILDLATGDSWQPYAIAITALTLITTIYTTIGGIKAVIWTDVIQATLMFTSAIVAIFTLLYHVGGGSLSDGFSALGASVPEMTTWSGYFAWGWEDAPADASVWEVIKIILANPYTLFAAFIAATVINMAAFGADQDMAQRLLTAENYKKSRRSLMTAAFMDFPIAAAFTFIGVLLIVFFEQNPELKPAKANDVFGVYILNVMPVVVRGFILAGLFATAMGSLSAALNALATSFTVDWYIPIIKKNQDDKHYMKAARYFTVVFAVIMIFVASMTAYINVVHPQIRLIPVVLGVAGLFLGPMLGVFLLGMLTVARGNDRGNMLAISAGLIGVMIFSGQYWELLNLFADPSTPLSKPDWVPQISFSWYAIIGASITLLIGLLFKTPAPIVENAIRLAREADAEENIPLAMRN